jgi:peptide/nickel transport system permease protein
LAVPLLLGISVLTFALVHLTPGSPVQAQAAMNPRFSQESVQALRRLYGLDQPLPVQYWHWLSRLARLDFGTSFRDQQSVLSKVAEALPATLLLNLLSLGLVLVIGIPFGVHAATHPGTRFTRFFTSFTFVAYSFPVFWLALLLQLSLAVGLGILPVSGYLSPVLEGAAWWRQLLDLLWHAAAPLVASTLGAWAVLSRYVRNSMFEALAQDYIRTARAKGLAERVVFWRHALPNALLPVITVLGLSLPGLISGSVIIETIFAWPGMGRLAWEATTGYDYPVVMGVSFIAALLTVLGNLAADLGLAALDPRIKVS